MRRSTRFALVAPLAFLVLHCTSNGDLPQEENPTPLPTRKDSGGGGTREDAGPTPDDGGSDTSAPSACDVTKPFGAPVRVLDFDANTHRASPRFSADELTIYFTTNSPTNSSELTMASRASKSGPFAGETVLPQSTVDAENDPTVGADGLTLWFHSLRNGSADLFLATRAAPSGPFGAAMVVPTANGATTIEATAYFRTSASELYFVSERTGSALLDVYVSKKSGSAFSTPKLVPELSSAGDELSPMVTEDGLTAIFGSDRAAGGKGKEDIWIAHRASDAVPFSVPSPLTELNSASTEQPGWISADGCRIWFSSGRDTADARQQIFYAVRPPL